MDGRSEPAEGNDQHTGYSEDTVACNDTFHGKGNEGQVAGLVGPLHPEQARDDISHEKHHGNDVNHFQQCIDIHRINY